MNVVIFTAHPASYGFAHKIAEKYRSTIKNSGAEAEIIDLYDPNLNQDFLSFENIKKDCGPTKNKTFYQEKIASADELVFSMPIWWGGPPAIFKNFLDVNLESGFAFNYQKGGKLIKHLKSKQVRFFMTADGPWIIYFVMRLWYSFWLNNVVFGFCGIRVKSIDVFTRMFKKKNDVDRSKMLKGVEKRANQSVGI